MQPRFNKGPSDWQNVFAISTRFRYIKVLFLYLAMTGVKKIVCYAGLCYTDVPGQVNFLAGQVTFKAHLPNKGKNN